MTKITEEANDIFVFSPTTTPGTIPVYVACKTLLAMLQPPAHWNQEIACAEEFMNAVGIKPIAMVGGRKSTYNIWFMIIIYSESHQIWPSYWGGIVCWGYIFKAQWIICLFAHIRWGCFNALRPRQSGPHFADDLCKCIFLNENFTEVCSSIGLAPARRVLTVNCSPTNAAKHHQWKSILVQAMAWCRQASSHYLSQC